MCNHAYWNLSGGLKSDIKGHHLQINAPFYLPVNNVQVRDDELLWIDSVRLKAAFRRNRLTVKPKSLCWCLQIPTGEVAPVKGTGMDFTTATPVGSRIKEVGADRGGLFEVRHLCPSFCSSLLSALDISIGFPLQHFVCALSPPTPPAAD